MAARPLFLRSNPYRSALMRQLAGFLPEGAPALTHAPRQDVTERLGQWLNVHDAIRLHSSPGALAAAGAAAACRAAPTPVAGLRQTLHAELQRVRGVLTQSILARSPGHKPDPNDLEIEFSLLHQRLNEQQRRLELSVDALRGHVRQQIAQSTPALAQLAALDAVMDTLFGGREQRLLTGLPALLKMRFNALRREAAAAHSSDTPPDLRWLQTFAAEFEQTLLAELDLRLQPVTGLIEALAHEP